MIFVTFTHFYGYKLGIVQNQVSAHPRRLKVDAIDFAGIHLGSLRNLLGRHHLWARSGEIGLSLFWVQSGTMSREKSIIFSLPRNWCSLPGQKSNNKSTGPTYRSYGAGWTQLGAVCWQPTGLMGLVGPAWGCMLATYGPSLGLYVGNLQVLWGLLDQLGAVCWQPMDPAWGCMLATYRSYGACWTSLGLYVGNLWTQLGAVCWQPTGLMGLLDQLGAVCWQPMDPAWGCMLATYRSYGACWTSLGLYVGNLQVLWGLLDQLGAVCWQPMDPAWGCMLATYRSYGLVGPAWGCMLATYGPSLGLYVGNLQVLWGLLDQLGAVCWQPTGLMGLVGPAWDCMLATCRSYGACGAPAWGCMLATYGPSLRLYVGNLYVLWGLLGPAWGCMLATLQVWWGVLDV